MDDVTRSMLSEKQIKEIEDKPKEFIENRIEWKLMDAGADSYRAGKSLEDNPYIHDIKTQFEAYYWSFGFKSAKSILEDEEIKTLKCIKEKVDTIVESSEEEE